MEGSLLIHRGDSTESVSSATKWDWSWREVAKNADTCDEIQRKADDVIEQVSHECTVYNTINTLQYIYYKLFIVYCVYYMYWFVWGRKLNLNIM
jgi:hypothetical protein